MQPSKLYSDWRHSLAAVAAISMVLWWVGWFFWTGNTSNFRQPFYYLTILPCWILIYSRWDIIKSLRRDAICIGTIGVCLWAVATLSYAQQQVEWMHLLDSLRYGVLIIGFVLGFYILRRYLPDLPLWIFAAIGISGLISALFLLCSWLLEMGPASNMARLDPGLALAPNTIRVANLYAAPLIIGTAMLLSMRRWWIKYMGAIIAATSMSLILWTQSRSGMISAVLVLFCMLVCKRHWWLLTASALIILSISTMMIHGDLGSRDLLNPRTVIDRMTMYQESFVRISEKPILGEGAWIISPQMQNGRWPHPHNIYLHLCLQGGLVALLLVLTLLAYALRNGYRVLSHEDQKINSIAFIGISFLFYYMIQGMVTVREMFTQPELSWLLFWLPIATLGSEYFALQQNKSCSISM